MQPVYPYIQVEKVEDKDSNLVQTIEDKPVVRVIGVPYVPASEEPLNFKTEQKIQVNCPPEEYMIKGEKAYFVDIRSIVAIV